MLFEFKNLITMNNKTFIKVIAGGTLVIFSLIAAAYAVMGILLTV